MSYHNAIQTPIQNPVGIDKVIEDICLKLSELSWHEHIFRRAFKIYEVNGKKLSTKGKAYLRDSNYYDVLSNDNFASMSFITIDSPEEINDETNSPSWNKARKRNLSVVFWVNLKSIYDLDYVYTELLKREVEKKLVQVELIDVVKYYDEDYQQVFKGFDFSPKDSQLLTFPYAGFRFECTAYYGGKPYDCE